MKHLGMPVAAIAFGLVLARSVVAWADSGPPSAEQLRASAATYVASAARASTRVEALLRASRGRGAAEETRCVSDALSRVDVAVRDAAAAEDALRAALAQGDAARASRAWLAVRFAYDRARSGEDLAGRCAPRSAVRPVDGTTVRVVVARQPRAGQRGAVRAK